MFYLGKKWKRLLRWRLRRFQKVQVNSKISDKQQRSEQMSSSEWFAALRHWPPITQCKWTSWKKTKKLTVKILFRILFLLVYFQFFTQLIFFHWKSVNRWQLAVCYLMMKYRNVNLNSGANNIRKHLSKFKFWLAYLWFYCLNI